MCRSVHPSVRATVRLSQNITEQSPILYCKYGLVLHTENCILFPPAFSIWPPGGHLGKHTMGHISWTLIVRNTKFCVWVHLATVLNILPRFWILPTFQGHRGQSLKSRANLTFWRCPIDIFWMDWSRSFRFGVGMYWTNISAKFDVGWIQVQDGRLADILFQNHKSHISVYVSLTVIARITIACGWMHLTTLLNILCEFFIWLTFQGHRGQHVKKVVQTWQFDDVRSISFERIDWQASISVGKCTGVDQYLGQVRCWLKWSGPRWPTGGHLASESKIAKQRKNYQFYALITVWCGILKTFFSLPHFQYGGQAAILENIQWVISPELGNLTMSDRYLLNGLIVRLEVEMY
jgi:hypothetical protein